MDFLSFCPSLLDILRFLEPDDILRCKDVNRFINGIIQKNVKNLPRHTIDLVLKTLVEKTTRAPYMLLTGSILLKTVYITPEHTLLMECPKQIFELYRLHGIAEETDINSEGDLIMQYNRELVTQGKDRRNHNLNPFIPYFIKNRSRSGYVERSYKRMRIYQHDRIQDGLRTIWNFIFNYYSCASIGLIGDMPTEWLNLLSECCEQNRVKCNWLGLRIALPGHRRLVKSIDCRELRVSNAGIDPNITKQNIIKNVDEITNWKATIKVGLLENERETSLAFASLIQQWCSGAWSMDKVSLCCRRHFGSIAILFGISEYSVLWDFEADNLSDVIRESVQITNVSSGTRSRDITIKRRCDNKVMEVSIRVEKYKEDSDNILRTIHIREQ